MHGAGIAKGRTRDRKSYVESAPGTLRLHELRWLPTENSAISSSDIRLGSLWEKPTFHYRSSCQISCPAHVTGHLWSGAIARVFWNGATPPHNLALTV